MTIAIGIQAVDGIVLCADSRYTSAFKTEGPKVFPWFDRGSFVLFAIAGNVPNAVMAVQECKGVLDAAPSIRTLIKMESAMKQAIKFMQEKYVDRIPINEREGARFDLLLAIGSRRDGMHLYYTGETGAVVKFDEYHCAGSGGYLAEYVMNRAYNNTMKVNDAVILATYALTACKGHDANCGGSSQFITVNNRLVSGVVPFDLAVMETQMSQYERKSIELLLQAGNFNLSAEDFDSRLKDFSWKVASMRSVFETKGAPWRKLVEQLESSTRPIPKQSASEKSESVQ